MKPKALLSSLPLLCTILFLTACQPKKPSFHVKGVIAGAEGKTLYLERQTLDGVQLVDTIKLSSSGEFHLKGEAPQYPDYYRLRLSKNEIIPFSVDSTETLQINASQERFSTDYKIEGNSQSPLIQKVWIACIKLNAKNKALKEAYNNKQLTLFQYTSQRENIIKEYKDLAKDYITTDPTSLVAYYALFQELEGKLIFNPYLKEDSYLFTSVANVHHVYTPNNPRSQHLYKLALQSIAILRGVDKQKEVASSPAPSFDKSKIKSIGYFDIKLPNAKGDSISLSSICSNKVTLLSFTSMSAEWSTEYNALIQSLLQKYSTKGLVLYQVSFDRDPHIWHNRVQRLSSTNVQEKNIATSTYIGLYNIQSLPTLFLLDKKGEIVLRVQHPEQLTESLDKLLAN